MFGKKKLLVIWVSSRQLVLMGGKVAVPEAIPLPENIVSNLEVVDSDGLYALVKDWVANHPGEPEEILWVFGPDVSFEHVMQETEQKEWDSVVLKFLDLLPFEEVESRSYVGTTTKVVAINKHFYDTLKRAFSLQGYVTLAEVMVGELGKMAGATQLDGKVYKYIVRNLDKIEKNRIVIDSVDLAKLRPHKEEKNAKLPLLIGVFVILIGILVFMVLRMNG